jgi:putative ABC transport system substrate-binding protein
MVVHRRNFMALLGGMSALWAPSLYAQPIGKRTRIGVLGAATDNPVMGPGYRAFVEEMRRLGFDEGQNLIVEHRPSEQDFSALSADAKELVSLHVDVLVALGAESSFEGLHLGEPDNSNCVRSQQF